MNGGRCCLRESGVSPGFTKAGVALFDYREHFIAIAAIFLALALGILIGVSFGDNFLVSNQLEIIERMEQELLRRKSQIDEKNEDLERWKQIKPIIWKSYREMLSGKRIALIAENASAAAEIHALLESVGAVVDFTAPGEFPQAEVADPETLQPECYVLFMEETQFELGQKAAALLLRLQQEEKRVIAVYPWAGEDALLLPEGYRFSAVDNIDTFWGHIALLQMIGYGIDGDYGFGPRRQGLIPLPSESP